MSKGFASEPISPVNPGDLVAGKYRVERVLGAGGMGIVVKAYQVELDRPVALKFLLPKVMETSDTVARFAREAKAAARLQSEHVVRILDVGALAEGAPYIVMEFLEGQDLSQLLAARGPLPVEQAVGFLLEAAEAVAEAHALGIVHRDLKPANLFLAKRTNGTPLIKVLDFGLSKVSGVPGEENVTSTSSLLGSPAYMSPEQLWSSRTAGVGSDIWSLGVVLYELLTARTPFPHDRMPELVSAILHTPARPIADWQIDVPAGLASTIYRCLEKEPGRRFADVGELATAFAPFGSPSAVRSLEHIANILASSKGERSIPEPDKVPPEITVHLQEREADSVAGASQTIRVARRDAHLDGRPGEVVRRRPTALAFAAVSAAVIAIGILATSIAHRGEPGEAGSAQSSQADPLAHPKDVSVSGAVNAATREEPSSSAVLLPSPGPVAVPSAEPAAVATTRRDLSHRDTKAAAAASASAGPPPKSIGSARPPSSQDALTRLRPL